MKALSTTLDRYSITDSVAAQLLEYVEARFKAGVANLESTRESIRQRQQAVATKLGLLTDTLLDGNIDRATYVQKQNELQSERATLKAKMQEIEQGQFAWLEPVRKWIKTAQRVHEITSSGTTGELRALAVEVFGSNLTLDGKILGGRAVEPWNALVGFNPSTSLVPVLDAIRTAFGIPE